MPATGRSKKHSCCGGAEKWLVYSLDNEDGGQVMVDIVMADSGSAAEKKVRRGRPYATIDGHCLLRDHIQYVQQELARPAAEIEAQWRKV